MTDSEPGVLASNAVRMFRFDKIQNTINRSPGTRQFLSGMYITGFWTHYLLSNASVMGKALLTNITRELAPEMRNSLP